MTPDGQSEVENLVRRRGRCIRAAIVLGVLFPIPPLVGLGGTIMGMLQAYGENDSLGTTGSVGAVDLSGMLKATSTGLVLSAILGLLFIMVITCAMRSHRKIEKSVRKSG